MSNKTKMILLLDKALRQKTIYNLQEELIKFYDNYLYELMNSDGTLIKAKEDLHLKKKMLTNLKLYLSSTSYIQMLEDNKEALTVTINEYNETIRMLVSIRDKQAQYIENNAKKINPKISQEHLTIFNSLTSNFFKMDSVNETQSIDAEKQQVNLIKENIIPLRDKQHSEVEINLVRTIENLKDIEDIKEIDTEVQEVSSLNYVCVTNEQELSKVLDPTQNNVINRKMTHNDRVMLDILQVLANRAYDDKDIYKQQTFETTLEDIHFECRGKTGKNKKSTLTQSDMNSYIQSIDNLCKIGILSNYERDYSPKMDTFKDSIKSKPKKGKYLIDKLIHCAYVLDENKKVIALRYSFGYWFNYEKVKSYYNTLLPKEIFAIDKNCENTYSSVKYLSSIATLEINKKRTKKELNFHNYTYAINKNFKLEDVSHRSRNIKRILKDLTKSLEMLKASGVITGYEVPNVTTKNYEDEETKIIMYFPNVKKNKGDIAQ